MLNYALIKELPKIELHCHMDGSLSMGFIRKTIEKQGLIFTTEELKDRICAPADCSDLAEYLARFTLPLACVQDEEGIEGSAYDVAMTAAEENVRYIEMRFAPGTSRVKGLKLAAIIDAAVRGMKRAEQECGISAGILCCGMRHLSVEDNIEMFRAAREFYGDGVVGLDLAGGEAGQTNAQWGSLFAEARRLGMPFTIHSGECGRAENVREAIELGAKRVGHGIAMQGHQDIIDLCREKKIGIEMCPTSNLQTKAISSIYEYPFREFITQGLSVSINTDNRTVSQTSCTKDILLLAENCGLTEEEYWSVYRNSVEASFASDDIKHRLLTKI